LIAARLLAAAAKPVQKRRAHPSECRLHRFGCETFAAVSKTCFARAKPLDLRLQHSQSLRGINRGMRGNGGFVFGN
jgi:hypothetical protein